MKLKLKKGNEVNEIKGDFCLRIFGDFKLKKIKFYSPKNSQKNNNKWKQFWAEFRGIKKN